MLRRFLISFIVLWKQMSGNEKLLQNKGVKEITTHIFYENVSQVLLFGYFYVLYMRKAW